MSLSCTSTWTETIIKKTLYEEEEAKPEPEPAPAPNLEFTDLEEEEVAVLANSQRVGTRIQDVLQSGGLTVR